MTDLKKRIDDPRHAGTDDALAEAGDLKKYRYIHLATHGMMDDRVTMNSAMILSQDNLPDAFDLAAAGAEICDGRLTAGSGDRGAVRQRTEAPKPFVDTCQELNGLSQVDAVYAMAFPVIDAPPPE